GVGGRVFARREGGVVGRRLRPGGVGGDRWHEEAGEENGQRNAAGALAQKAQTRCHIGYLPSRERCKGTLLDPCLRSSICWVPRKRAIPHFRRMRSRRERGASESCWERARGRTG